MSLLEIKNGLRELETRLQLAYGTLSKTQGAQSSRGISARTHQILLESIASKFPSSHGMRDWMSLHWPRKLLDLAGGALESLYESIDLENQIPQLGIFPSDYVERDEKPEILHLLVAGRETQVIWITGPGGSGKSTLALSLLRRNWDVLKRHFEKVFWVNIEQGGYTDGLRQIGESLDLAGQSSGSIEQKLRNLTRRSKVLIILDALHDVAGLAEWRQLAGYLGRLVVTSRTRLTESELRADGLLHQVRLAGLSLEQGRQFLGSSDPAVNAIIEQTQGLPLALRLLNGLMLELGLSAAQILNRLQRYTFDILEFPPGLERRDASLRACFDLTWEILGEKHPGAQSYFQACGIFHTRRILKTLLEQIAGVPEPLTGDRLAASLQRYNFLEIISVHGERFVQLHPLFHEYAREKLAMSGLQDHIQLAYLDALPRQINQAWQSFHAGEYPAAARWLSQDTLIVLTELMAQAEWEQAARLFSDSFDLLLQEGYAVQLEGMLYALDAQIRDDNDAARLLRVALMNHAGSLALTRLENTTAQQYFELAFKIGEQLLSQSVDAQAVMTEMGCAILGQVRCLMNADRPQVGLDLLRSVQSVIIFSGLENSSLLIDRDLLTGELYIELGKPALALEYFESVFDALGNTVQARAALAFQADCYRQMGNLEKALEIFTNLYTEILHPIGARAELGLDLAGCLAESRQFVQALSLLDEIERLLADYEGWPAFNPHFARLWKYRAFNKHILGDRQGVIENAKRSLAFWAQIPGSGKEQEQMRSLLAGENQ